MQETLIQFLVRKIPWRQNRLPTPVFLGFPGGSAGKESACNVGDLGLIPGLGRSLWEGNWLPTPVFWPGEFHELYSPQGCKESDTTELSLFTSFTFISIGSYFMPSLSLWFPSTKIQLNTRVCGLVILEFPAFRLILAGIKFVQVLCKPLQTWFFQPLNFHRTLCHLWSYTQSCVWGLDVCN